MARNCPVRLPLWDDRDRQGEDIPQLPGLSAVEGRQTGLLAEVLLEENLAGRRLGFEARQDGVRAAPLRVDQVGVGGFHGWCSENLDLTEWVPAVKHAEDPQPLAARHVGRR